MLKSIFSICSLTNLAIKGGVYGYKQNTLGFSIILHNANILIFKYKNSTTPQLVNAMPAESPAIKKTVTQLANPILGIPRAVLFELNEYIPAEGIKKFRVFRSTNPIDALSVRTMTPLTQDIDVANDVLDDFSGLPFPPFGEPLFYRIVALREIKNEQGAIEFVPSKPSNPVLTNIVDNTNPPAPLITSVFTVVGNQLIGVTLSWAKTAHNAIYYLYKMNSTGNWVKIYSVKTNADPVSIDLAQTDLGTNILNKQDADGNTIYHRFRVQVENSSGLLNIEQNELTI